MRSYLVILSIPFIVLACFARRASDGVVLCSRSGPCFAVLTNGGTPPASALNEGRPRHSKTCAHRFAFPRPRSCRCGSLLRSTRGCPPVRQE